MLVLLLLPEPVRLNLGLLRGLGDGLVVRDEHVADVVPLMPVKLSVVGGLQPLCAAHDVQCRLRDHLVLLNDD